MKVLRDLLEVSSKREKIKLLEKCSDIEKKVFYYAYHPHMKYGIVNPGLIHLLGEPSEEMFDLLDELASSNINDELRNKVEGFRKLNGDLILYICRKNLDCGVSVGTLNKVFPNFIPQFKIQLAKEVPLNSLVYPLIAEIKFDGVRVISRVENGVCTLYTRNGKIINSPQLSSIIESMSTELDMTFDGEVTTIGGKMSGRTSISGRINSALKGGELVTEDMHYNIFDCMSTEDFDLADCGLFYSTRRIMLEALIPINSDVIKYSEGTSVSSAEEANDYYTDVIRKGYEGLIMKSDNHKYTFKRTKDWIKVKAIKSADLECMDIQEGDHNSKYRGMIGALICTGVVEGKTVYVNVGSGLTDKQRNLSYEEFIGSKIEIKYNDVIENYDKSGYTLFLPRFVSIRFDKC